eukprot:74771-Alexandrium_andersonii.AAC.1
MCIRDRELLIQQPRSALEEKSGEVCDGSDAAGSAGGGCSGGGSSGAGGDTQGCPGGGTPAPSVEQDPAVLLYSFQER